MRKKGYLRRYLFEGWNNYTEFEKEGIKRIKEILLDQYGIDMDKKVPFGDPSLQRPIAKIGEEAGPKEGEIFGVDP